MVKLNSKIAKDVDARDVPDDFSPLPNGRYLARLEKVEPQPPKTQGGFGQWEIQWSILENIDTRDDSCKGRKMRNWLSLSDKDYPRQQFKAFFVAFDVSADTDTDELLGSEAVLVISQNIAQAGKLAGKLVNDVDRILPADIDLAADGVVEEPF